MKDSGHTWAYKEDIHKAGRDLSASRAKVKELETQLKEAIKEYKRIHDLLCEGFDYYDERSEEFLSKHKAR